MAASPIFIDLDFLTARMGPETMIALFDDTATRVVNTEAVVAVLASATERAQQWIVNSYGGTLPFAPNAIPSSVKELCFLYARAMSFERNLDYIKATGSALSLKELYAQADMMGARLQASVLRMVDAPAAKPTNVGGFVYDNAPRILVDSPNGCRNSGDF